jgi:hypothetical protein
MAWLEEASELDEGECAKKQSYDACAGSSFVTVKQEFDHAINYTV